MEIVENNVKCGEIIQNVEYRVCPFYLKTQGSYQLGVTKGRLSLNKGEGTLHC